MQEYDWCVPEKHKYCFPLGLSSLKTSIRLISFMKWWITPLLLGCDWSTPELLSSCGSKVQLKSPAIIQAPDKEAIVRNMFWKKLGSSAFGAYTFIRVTCSLRILPWIIKYRPALPLITLWICSGIESWIKVMTPLAWEGKGAERILPFHPLLILSSSSCARWVSWRNTILDCNVLILFITYLTFFHSPLQFQDIILTLRSTDTLHNCFESSQHFQ